MKKNFYIEFGELFRPSVVVKIWERILFRNGEKFMFFLFFRDPQKIL